VIDEILFAWSRGGEGKDDNRGKMLENDPAHFWFRGWLNQLEHETTKKLPTHLHPFETEPRLAAVYPFAPIG